MSLVFGHVSLGKSLLLVAPHGDDEIYCACQDPSTRARLWVAWPKGAKPKRREKQGGATSDADSNVLISAMLYILVG